MKITIYLNNGKEIKVEDSKYNAETFASLLNEQTTMMIALGNAVINKHTITLVMPTEVIEGNAI